MSYDTSPEDQAKTAARYAAEVKHCHEVAKLLVFGPPHYISPPEEVARIATVIQRERSEAIVTELLRIVEEWNEDKARLARYMSPEQVAQACAAARDAALEDAASAAIGTADDFRGDGLKGYEYAALKAADRIRALKAGTP